jgi:hypothetical protein
MRANRLAWTLVLALLPLTSSLADAGGLNFTVNTESDKPTLTCDDLELRFWDGDGQHDIVTARRSKTVTLQMNGSTPFVMVAPNRGGVRVQPSSDGSFTATVCMAAGARTEAHCEQLLDRISVVNHRGELKINGPAEVDDWAAEILVSVPNGAKLDLSAENGGLQIKSVNGDFRLRTQNGPISVKHVTGAVIAETQNGPIHFRGHEGNIRLTAQNGPVSVYLDATSWKGKGLDASTQNGPVSFKGPDGMKSGVEVASSWHSPAKFNGRAILMGQEDGSRTFQFGDGPTLVRLSTVNGPVDVRAPDTNPKSKSKSKSYKDEGI